MQRGVAVIAAMALLSGVSVVQADVLTGTAESKVEIRPAGEEGLLEIVRTNRSFDWVGIYRIEREGYQHLLLRKTEQTTINTGLDGVLDSAVTLEVFEVDADRLKQLYSLSDDGEVGRIQSLAWANTYFLTTRYGCCGALDTERLYSLESGRFLFSQTGDPAWFEVPNSRGLVRLAGAHSLYSVDDQAAFGDRQDVLALISYATPTEPLQRFFIVATSSTEELDYGGAEIGWSERGEAPSPELTVWSADGKRDLAQVRGLSLVVAFSPRLVARVPLVAGELALEQAELAPGLTLEAVPLD